MFRRKSLLLVLLVAYLTPASARAQTSGGEPAGALQLQVNVDTVLVVIDRAYADYHVVTADVAIPVAAGRHEVLITSRWTADRVLDVEVAPGQTVVLKVRLRALDPAGEPAAYRSKSSYPALIYGGNLAVVSDVASTISVDRKTVGTGTALLQLAPGSHLIGVTTREGASIYRQVQVPPDPGRLRVVKLFVRPAARRSAGISVIPGAAQFYKQQPWKAGLFIGSMTAALAAAYWQHSVFHEENLVYNDLRLAYTSADTEQEAKLAGDQMERQYDRALLASRWRNGLLWATAALYLLNILDGQWAPESGWREEPQINWAPHVAPAGIGVALEVRYR